MALTFASALVADRLRAARRRTALNRALHELRRPLQALALDGAAGGGQLDRAIEAIAGLDREVNGGKAPRRRRVDARALAEQAAECWRAAATRAGRPLGFAWRAGSCEVECDPDAVARALDNLIANALEHGSGPVRIEGSGRPGRVRLHVVDRGVQAVEPRSRRDGDPRRGHGLRIVGSIAAEHGGRFAACSHRHGTSAVLELPLAP
jgi:two-component system, OmpR family, sensor kinase